MSHGGNDHRQCGSGLCVRARVGLCNEALIPSQDQEIASPIIPLMLISKLLTLLKLCCCTQSTTCLLFFSELVTVKK